MSDSPDLVIELSLVRRLIAAQFPHWAELEISVIEPNGWDNRTFRLGEQMSVRLPSAERYGAQVAKEQRWLPELAQHVPLPIPAPVAMGQPGEDYPWAWSVYRWLAGETASVAQIQDRAGFAGKLAGFLKALQQIAPAEGPLAGAHNFFRGGHLSVYDGETRAALEILSTEIDRAAATAVWETALETSWQGLPVWVHGDVSPANLLVSEGQLCAVIDFGSCGVGDPACDLTIAWTFFSGQSRQVFRDELALDQATWDRARGWALWKALISLVEYRQSDLGKAAGDRSLIANILAEQG